MMTSTHASTFTSKTTSLRVRISIALLAALSLAAGFLQRPDVEQVLDAGFHHLGDDEAPEWPEASLLPEGQRYDLSFEPRSSSGEKILILTQRDVNNRWVIRINGVEVGVLKVAKAQETHYYPVETGILVEGENQLSIVGDVPTDDITLGDVRLIHEGFREHFDLQRIEVRVIDADTGRGVPARVTVTDVAGELVPIFYAERPETAVRRGIVYTSEGELTFEVAAGEYRIHATRGMEWSMDSARVSAQEGATPQVDLSIRREVDTTGWVACDTHIHTLTHSGHGDSSVEERLVTLAGEGVELAIATDHNHNTDYRPLQESMQLTEYFTVVTGNEVTTSNGHFNAFPLDPDDEVPPYDVEDWVELVEGIRAKGAQVVILNHPRWPDLDSGPYGVFGLDRFTGERASGTPFTFDAMELVNSTEELPDPHYLLRDWFALLARGETIKAVGSSDSHTVGDPVGQGRTYVKSSQDDPALIDVDEACRSFLKGEISVSQGIFVDAVVNDRYGLGSLVTHPEEVVTISLRVAAPSWIRPEKATVFFNGVVVAEAAVPTRAGEPTDIRLRLHAPRPAFDAHVVCLVTGPGVDGPWWPTLNPYTMGATNPIYLDVDGNGVYDSPRASAMALLEAVGTEPARLREALVDCDEAVAVQALDLVRAIYVEEAYAKLQEAASLPAQASAHVRGYIEASARGVEAQGSGSGSE